MKKTIKTEDQYIISYLKHRGDVIDYIGIPDNPDPDVPELKSPDYYLPKSKQLIEVKRVYDSDEMRTTATWASIVEKLKEPIRETLETRNIEGTYLVSIPNTIRIKNSPKEYNKIAEVLINAIISRKSSIGVAGHNVKIKKISDNGSQIAFVSSGGARSINVANIIFENVKDLLESANDQLAYDIQKPVSKKVVLLVNNYRLLSWDWDIFDGISYAYKKLLGYKNIDQVWIQSGDKHTLLFDKALFQRFENESIDQITTSEAELFSKWFSPLEKIGSSKSDKLVTALQSILDNAKPHEIFREPYTRINMVRFGRWLAENGRRDEAIWLVKQFLNDPDPVDPPTKEEKSDFNASLHYKVKNASAPNMHAIYTVKGHLAWTVQMLVLKKDRYLVDSFNITKSVLINTKNCYVVLQWLYPLIEISNRRFWLKELSEKAYEDFKNLSFDLLAKYGKYPDIAQALVRVFHHYRNLSTKEARVVLDKLENATDYEAILVYFALYRESHFIEGHHPKEVRNYDSSYALGKLEKIVVSESSDLLDLRSNIAWNFWQILSENKEEFDRLAPWIDKFIDSKYDKHLFHNFERIIEDHIEERTDKCLNWFIKIVSKAGSSVNEMEEPGSEVWLSSKTGYLLRVLAKHRPKELINIVESLHKLWLANSYIGSITEIFSSYQHIKDDELKTEVKETFKKIYIAMKEINPKLQKMDWSS